MTITAAEFLAAYAERSGVTPAHVLATGRVAATCHCDYEGCEGWQVSQPDNLLPWRGETIVTDVLT